MKFSDSSTASVYFNRIVDESWVKWCQQTIVPTDKVVVDIGCGGGIYSRVFAQCGASLVIGVDLAKQYVDRAKKELPTINFINASAEKIALGDDVADIVFERALIHHLDAQQKKLNASELYRILQPGGIAVVQDRTLDNVKAQEDEYYIRRELFRMFPRLIEFEKARRPDVSIYAQVLRGAGFGNVRSYPFPEVRCVYKSAFELDRELSERKGKSILFQLSDSELAQYRKRIVDMSVTTNIVECDQWHIWIAQKPF